MFAIIITCFVVVGIIMIFWNINERKNLPPGPKGLPVIGKWKTNVTFFPLLYSVKKLFLTF